MRRKLGAIVSAIVLIPIGVIGGTALVGMAPAGAAPVTLSLSCQTSGVPVIGSLTSVRNQVITSTVVDHVYESETFGVAITPAAGNESSDAGSGATLRYIQNLRYRVNVPANSQLLGYSISGGFGLGAGTPSVSLSGSTITILVPGQILPNTNYQLPTLNMTLKATGAALTTIQPKLAGTSYADPGLEMTVNADLPSGLGNANLPTACFPSSSIALSTTTIWPIDHAPPVATIASPADGATFAQGFPVNASYSCNDGPFGIGVATCSGPVASGSPIDTATLGLHTFTVTSSDLLGNSGTTTNSYTVVSDPGVTVRSGWANEGVGGQVGFRVSLTRAPSQTVTVHYATADGSATAATDYVAASGDLTFNPGGATSQIVNVAVRDDAVYELAETFSLTLSAPVHAVVTGGPAAGRIRDTDQPTVRVLGATVAEGTGAVVPMKVSIAGHGNVPVTVSYTTADTAEANHAVANADYTPVSGTLTFTPGAALSQTVNVPVLNDAVWEADAERFAFNVTNPANGQTASAPGAISDDEAHPPVVSISNVSIREGEVSRQVFIPVTLDKPLPVASLVRYSTSNVTATSPTDYAAQANQQVVFEAGQVSAVIKIPVVGDAVNETDEAFRVTLFSPFGLAVGTATGTVWLINDDAPSSVTPVMSVNDVRIVEGDSGTAIVDATVMLNVKAPAKITASISTAPISATANVDYTTFTHNVTFLKGATEKHFQIKVKNDLTVESDEGFYMVLSAIVGATPGKTLGGVVIADNDNPLPTTPTGITAVKSLQQLGGTEVSWNAATTPLADWPLTGYEYRVSTNAGATYGAWTSTGAGTSTWFVQACGQGVSCTYQVRGVNKKGPGASAGQATATGLGDTTSPAMAIYTPTNRGNLDKLSATTLSGDAGIEGGDTLAVGVNVYPCNACSNIAPTYSAFTLPVGGTWSVSPNLAPGVYSALTAQSDWAGHTTFSALTTFEVRDAIFVSPFGNDANVGSVTAPKLTIGAGAAAASAAGRPQVAVAAGTFAPASGVAISGSVSVLGGFDETSGWSRPGSAGAVGTPDRNLTQISGTPQGVAVTGNVNVTLDALTIQGLNTGLGAGASVYGVRAIGASAALPASVTISNSKVTAAPGLDGTDSSASGSDSAAVGCTGSNWSTYTTGNGATCNPGAGGRGIIRS